MKLSGLTTEQRQQMREKARATRAANTAARRASTLRTDFMDAALWEELARQRGIRLPPWGKAATVSTIRTWLHKVSMSQKEWEIDNGCKLQRWLMWNSDWPLRAFAGLTLEYLEDKSE